MDADRKVIVAYLQLIPELVGIQMVTDALWRLTQIVMVDSVLWYLAMLVEHQGVLNLEEVVHLLVASQVDRQVPVDSATVVAVVVAAAVA